MSNPKISVVVPCYNRAHLLDETLGSVMAQSFADWECVIVDGGSDDTYSVAQKWVARDSRFKYFRQVTSGLAAARNFAISQSSGAYVFPLDDDDLIAPGYFEKALPLIEQDASVKVVHCRVMQFGHTEGELKLPDYSFANLLLRNCMISCCLYRRADFDRVGGYDERLHILEDWDFWLSILDGSAKVKRIDEFLYRYRKYETGSLVNTFSENRQRHEEHLKLLYKKHIDKYFAHHGNPVKLYSENQVLRAFRDKTAASLPYRIFKMFRK